jgi:hypothetical protein
MKDKTERETPNSQGSVPVDRFGKVLPSRRRLLTGGLAAAPILASIESRNALAVACLTPSGNLSGNVSTGAQAGTCVGISTQAWDQAPAGNWPNGSDTQNIRFHDIFAIGPNADFGNDKLKKIVGESAPSNGEARSLAAYIVAAYLNVLKGWVMLPGLDQAALINLLKAIWSDYATYGAYKVNSTVSWSASQIITYLTSNGLAGT